MGAREDIAAAASTVDGISAHPYFVQGSNPGHAYVVWQRVDYPDQFGGIARWSVVVVLPQGAVASAKYTEEKLPLLLSAIRDHLVVTEAVPDRLDLKDGSLPCLVINGHTED